MNEIVLNDHFTDLREQIGKIKEENEKTIFNYESEDGEREARSHVYKLRQSKSAIAKRHKEAKSDILKSGKELDAAKKELTADIEEMIEIHAAPLKAKQARIDKALAEKKALEEFNLAHDDALVEDSIFNRERVLKLKEEAAARAEAQRVEKEAAKRAEAERIEHEARLKKKADEKAMIDAEEKFRAGKEAAVRKIREAEEAEVQARREAERAQREAEKTRIRVEKEAGEAEKRRVQELKTAESRRVADLKAAEDAAERRRVAEKQEAERAQREKEAAEKKERERIEREEVARKADVEHRRNINAGALAALIGEGISHVAAKKTIEAVAKGLIPNIVINY
jgi:hypothetical protein